MRIATRIINTIWRNINNPLFEEAYLNSDITLGYQSNLVRIEANDEDAYWYENSGIQFTFAYAILAQQALNFGLAPNDASDLL